MWSIDEAITYFCKQGRKLEEYANLYIHNPARKDFCGNDMTGYNDNMKQAKEQFQVAEWLKELKVLKSRENTVIAELEKIKAEIGEAYPYFDSADVHWGFNICRDILDNHIKELKGENNG